MNTPGMDCTHAKQPVILVVDDEPDIREVLQYNLEAEGYLVSAVESAEEALAADLCSVDVAILDVMMEGMSGYELAKELLSNPSTSHIRIIFLTAKTGENHVVTGLQIGADDYVCKPFSVREVMLRVKAVLRRSVKPSQKGETYSGLSVDTDGKAVVVDGNKIDLTPAEYGIIAALAAAGGRVLSREELICRAWPDESLVTGRTVDTNVARLRKKLGPYAAAIATRPGYGYFFKADC